VDKTVIGSETCDRPDDMQSAILGPEIGDGVGIMPDLPSLIRISPDAFLKADNIAEERRRLADIMGL
jgi:hypothetical protein